MKRIKWLLLLLIALGLRALLPPAAIESAYGKGLFPAIRLVQGSISALSPFPLVYLLVSALLVAGILAFARKGVKKGLWAVLSAAFSLAFFFILLWGFNYQRIPFEQKTGLKAVPLDPISLEEEFDWATEQVLDSRKALGEPMDQAVSGFYAFRRLEEALFPRVKSVVENWGYPAMGRVRARLIHPKGILLRFSSSGVYLPWTGEGHIDAGLYPLNWPFVMAHEMSHGYGIANEGVCNFLAFQVCSTDPDPYIRYSGTL